MPATSAVERQIERVERRRKVGWWMLIAGGFAAGVGLGLMLFR